MDWTDTWRDAFRTELRAEAIGFACHGWPVVPGTYPSGSNWVGRGAGRQPAGVGGPVPVHPHFAELAGGGPEEVARLWAGHPFSVLLATGLGVDALDLPADVGRGTAIGLRVAGLPVPIAATPAGRWIFPVAGGGVLHPALVDHPDVVLHADGSWVPLPPSPCLPGVVHWRVKPGVRGWQLPRLHDVADAVLAATGETQGLQVTDQLKTGHVPLVIQPQPAAHRRWRDQAHPGVEADRPYADTGTGSQLRDGQRVGHERPFPT